MQSSTKLIAIGVSLFAITVLGLFILFQALPISDLGFTGKDFTMLSIDRIPTPPAPTPFLNISESQIGQCPILKTTCQELIDNDLDSITKDINTSEANCITSFLESLSPKGTHISLIYYQGFFFEIGFIVP
jgi:hypothetical protein